jgi:phage terminase large subunit GpA-like protein
MSVLRFLAPPPSVRVDEWADQHRVLTSESSAEPGKWRTDRTPYLREPMQVCTDPNVEIIVVMASAQVGKTELCLNLLGRTIHVDPGPVMYCASTLEIAEDIARGRVAPLLRTPPLDALVTSEQTLRKEFVGGQLTLAGSNSPSSLASRPIRILLADEVDRWDASLPGEGDPLSLAMKRTQTFRNRKILIISSPTMTGASRIAKWYQLSDQRRFHTPCLRCGIEFVIQWADVRWDDHDPRTARIECPHCAGRIEEHERHEMIAAGRWIAQNPESRIAGFHIWEIFAPWRSLADQVEAFLVAKRSTDSLQAWVNTSRGETWDPPAQKAPEGLALRRESYPAELPAGVRILTAGIDTQDDRLVVQILGWGENETAWVIGYEHLIGDPNLPEVWQQLDALLTCDFQHELTDDAFRIRAAFVDSAGHRTQAVYNYCAGRLFSGALANRIWPIIGRGNKGQLISQPSPVTIGTRQYRILRTLDVDQLKTSVVSRLSVAEPGSAEYVHFPSTLGHDYFEELTSESLVTKHNRWNVPSKVWKKRSTSSRNEALDTFVYALGSLRLIAPTPAAFARLVAAVDTYLEKRSA